MRKNFKLQGSDIKPVANGYGACIASDRITVDGGRVGYMYREAATNKVDSGWRFFSGTESQEYVDLAGNCGLYDVNTIANYDPDIVALLDAPTGSAFERHPATGRLEKIDSSAIPL